MRKSIMLLTFVSCFLILMIPNISAVECNVIADEKKSHMMESIKKISNYRSDLINRSIEKRGFVSFIKNYAIITIIIFILVTLYDLIFAWMSIADSIYEGLMAAIFWPWILLVFIIAELYGWGPVL